jgi:hypothetical protein
MWTGTRQSNPSLPDNGIGNRFGRFNDSLGLFDRTRASGKTPPSFCIAAIACINNEYLVHFRSLSREFSDEEHTAYERKRTPVESGIIYTSHNIFMLLMRARRPHIWVRSAFLE